MNQKTDFLFKVLNVLSWGIFIGLCIESGGLIVNAFVSIFINPVASSKFWGGLNLYDLYKFNQNYFIAIVTLMIIVSVLKSILFYWIVNLFHKKKLNLSSPFNNTLGRYIFKLSYMVFGIGLFTYCLNQFSHSLKIKSNGLFFPSIQNIKFEDADVWIFMGVILLIFAMIFKKGIEIQTENDLTV